MSGKKILWLCSWYPNRVEPFNGDFIQRHARAASLFDDIYVIHVAGYNNSSLSETEEVSSGTGTLTEQIILYKKESSFLSPVIAQYRWLQLYKSAVKKYVVQYGLPDYVHVHVPVKAGLIALWIKRKYGIPYMLTEHWGIYNDAADDNYEGRSILFKQLTRRVAEGAAKFISVSRFLAEGVNKLVTKKDYQVVLNTVDTSIFLYKEKQPDRFRFIHVSNMVPLKNAAGILRAFKLFIEKGMDAELVMIGDTQPGIRNLAGEIGLTDNQVRFCGEIPYPQVAAEMQLADCFILFSNIENSPCVIGEALCCGLPVIASRVGGVPELVNEDNSLLVAVGDEEELAGAMEAMVGQYASYNRKKIAEDANGKFSYTVIGKQISDLYR